MALNAGAAFIKLLADLTPLKSQMATQVPAEFKKAGAVAGAGFKGGLKGAVGKLKDVGLGPGAIAAIGVTAVAGAVAGLKRVADQTADYADEVESLSEVTGASAEDASRLTAVLKAVGIETGAAARPFVFLTDAIAKGGKDLRNYFSAADIARFSQQDLATTTKELADKFQELGEGQERTQFLTAAFGRRGATLMHDLLEVTDDETESIENLAEAQGLIFNAQQLNEAREYRIAMRQLDQTFKGLTQTVGKAVIPLFTDIAQGVSFGVTKTKEVAGGIGDLLKPVSDFMEKYGTVHVDEDSPQWLKDMFPLALKAKEGVEELGDSLIELETQALEGNEDAAKQLGEAYKQAFAISEKAAQAFEQRLSDLVPALGETFRETATSAEDSADKILDAADSVADATDSLADAEDRLASAREKVKDQERFLLRTPERERDLADARRDVADAERDLAGAKRDLAKAQRDEERAKAGKGDDEEPLTAGALKKSLEKNTEDLNAFGDHLGTLEERFAEISTKGGEAIEESFLAHLAALGPEAVPLLKELVNLSDAELAALAGTFGDQISAAKKAADFEFDKFPANFQEKIAAARGAAADELEKLVGQFQALPDQADPSGQWGEKMKLMALSIQQMSEEGLIALSDVEEGFLETALNADTTGERVEALQLLINSLEGKTVPIEADVDFSDLDQLERTLNKFGSRQNAIELFLEPVILPSRKGSKKETKAKPAGEDDEALADLLLPSHSGGEVLHKGGFLHKHLGERLRSDERHAILQTGEFVIQRSAVDKIGVDFLRRLNAGNIDPRDDELTRVLVRHDGGSVDGRPQPASVTHSKTSTTTIHIGEVRAHNYNDFERQMEEKRRLAVLRGF